MFRLDDDGPEQPEKPRKPKEASEADPLESIEIPELGAEPIGSTEDEESVVVVETSLSPYLVLFHEPTVYRAEQIRLLRNKLIAMNPDSSAKTLVVTSAQPGEGKTSTAINLAMAFAERERTPVILVDADMRSPSVETQLQINLGAGLSEELSP